MSIAKTKKQITFNVALSEEADFLIDILISVINSFEKFLFFEIKEEAVLNFFRRCGDIQIGRLPNNFWKRIEGNFNFSETLTEEARIFLAGIFVVGSVMWIGNGDLISIAHSEQNSEITNAQTMGSMELKNNEDASSLKSNSEIPKVYSTKSQEAQCQEDKAQKKSSNLCGKDDTQELMKIEKERIANAATFAPRPRVASCGLPNEGGPSYSKTKGKHMDEDCCPDPDEWAKPGCVYDALGLSILIGRPK